MELLEKYLYDLFLIKSSGMAVKETSYYGTLETFLNEIGSSLKPSVKVIINTKNIGSGIPDGGFFTKEQFPNGHEIIKDFVGTLPSRGALEIKGTSEEINVIANSSQVKKYLPRYGQVLVTNYYQFLLVIRDENGKMELLEKYSLAENENIFWLRAGNSKNFAEDHQERLIQYLMRVMLHQAPLSEPKDVAWFFASYAKDARTRIELLEIQTLEDLKKALEVSLGVSFSSKDGGNHFFKSTLVQTIFYGVFSAWVLFNKDKSKYSSKFDWRLTGWYLKVPMITALFDRVASPSSLNSLNIVEVLDWTTAVLNRIEKNIFFNKFQESEAVLYFYEPFLEAFDPELRKELGVWYTPKEIVQYMVEKVDNTLRNELNIPKGLADKNVFVLDPCCGTGAYLVEILRKIHETLKAEGDDLLIGEDLKEALMTRVFGFEILLAPFVVSHLQLGVLLQNFGVTFDENKHERAGVYLTNSLTGWETIRKDKLLIAFPELQEEKDAAEHIKRDTSILVIIGNPPYNAFAGVSTEEEHGIVDVYKEGLREKWGIGKYNLDDLYIRFFRIAEKRIVGKSGKGIVCFISNFSYTYEPSFVVMREHMLSNFNKIWIDSLNGDSRETGKTTPDGKPDPSVFSTSYNKEGIRKGTAITTMVKYSDTVVQVNSREFWGIRKKEELLNSVLVENYDKLEPAPRNKYILRNIKIDPNYLLWPLLPEISKTGEFPAFMESREGVLIDIDLNRLQDRMNNYFNKIIEWDSLKITNPELTKDFAGFDAKKTRNSILKYESYDQSRIYKYIDRPFDVQWCYYPASGGIWHRGRPDLHQNYFTENKFLATRLNSEKVVKGSPLYFSKNMIDCQALARNVSVIPFLYKSFSSKKKEKLLDLFDTLNNNDPIPNISERTIKYLTNFNLHKSEINSNDIWFHCIAIGYSPKYLSDNRDALKNDYPRIPLPAESTILKISSDYGKRIADLLDTEVEIQGITVSPSLLNKSIAFLSTKNNATIQLSNLEIKAQWGNKTKQGVMPGKGKYEKRNYTQEEYDNFLSLGYDKNQIDNLFGETTFDIFLNDNLFWKNIPFNVWNYYIGGYQVIKKWLSYREESIINRPLKKEEVREVTNISRRIVNILLLEKELDENYLNVKDKVYQWV